MMIIFSVLLFHSLLGVLLSKTFFDPSNEGQERIENIRISNVTDEKAIIEWDYYTIRDVYPFRFFTLVTEPPILVQNGNPVHPTTSVLRPEYMYFLIKPDTQYNVTIRAEATDQVDDPLVAISDMLTFTTLPSMPEITFVMTNDSELNYTIACLAEGSPLPETSISHNGKPLRLESLTQDLILLQMKINLTPSSYGTYTCTATNKAGTVSKDIELSYTDSNPDAMINTMAYLLKKTEDIEMTQDTKMSQMEQTLNTMKQELNEIQQQLQNKTAEN